MVTKIVIPPLQLCLCLLWNGGLMALKRITCESTIKPFPRLNLYFVTDLHMLLPSMEIFSASAPSENAYMPWDLMCVASPVLHYMLYLIQK